MPPKTSGSWRNRENYFDKLYIGGLCLGKNKVLARAPGSREVTLEADSARRITQLRHHESAKLLGLQEGQVRVNGAGGGP